MTNTKFSGALGAVVAYLIVWAVRSAFVAVALALVPWSGASFWDGVPCAVVAVLAARVVLYKLEGFDGDDEEEEGEHGD